MTPVSIHATPGEVSRWHRALIGLTVIAVALAVVGAMTWSGWDSLYLDLWLMIGGMVAFTIVGSLIEDRRPGQAVGRICLAIGILLIVVTTLAITAIDLDSGPGPIPSIGAAMALLAWIGLLTTFILGIPLLVSRFPDGRDLGRMSDLLDLLLVFVAVFLVASGLQPGPLRVGWIEPADNPLAIAGIAALGGDAGSQLGFVGYFAALGLAAVGLARRYARGGPVARAQIRWFAAAVGFSMIMLVPIILVFAYPSVGEVGFLVVFSAWALSLLLPPIAIGIAILRYRLYDIDRIVSNAIGYGLVTIALFGIFFAVNVTLVSSVSPLVEGSGIAVAASTLLVAALFNPLRVRVQRRVDRRFHRARYDADRMVAEFSGRLRDEIEITRLRQDILEVVDRSVAPSEVGLWLRPGSAR